MYDARQVANFLLDLSDRCGIPVTHLALQKIVYFAHGLAYARFGQPLLLNRTEAWKNGPVIRELYFAFRDFGDRPIDGRAEILSFKTRRKEPIRYDFPTPIAEHLREVFEVYGPLPPWRLVAMTHEKGTPWEKTISQAMTHANVGMHIDEKLIRDFFASSSSTFAS